MSRAVSSPGPLSQWRKVAMATWSRSNDPLIRSSFEVDAVHLLDYLREVRQQTGVRVTPVHLVGRAVARAIRAVPAINGRIVAGVFRPVRDIDIAFAVSLRAELSQDAAEVAATDLSATKVAQADQKAPWVIAAELAHQAREIRAERDPVFRRTKQVARWLPAPLLRPLLGALTFLTEDLGVALPPPLGVPARPFGSFLVTNLGTFGLGASFVPLPTVCRCMGAMVVGTVVKKPVVVDDEVVVRPVLPLSVTIDHRYVDGYQGAVLARALCDYLEDPARFDPIRASAGADSAEAPAPTRAPRPVRRVG